MDKSPDRFFTHWDSDAKTYTLQLHFKRPGLPGMGGHGGGLPPPPPVSWVTGVGTMCSSRVCAVSGARVELMWRACGVPFSGRDAGRDASASAAAGDDAAAAASAHARILSTDSLLPGWATGAVWAAGAPFRLALTFTWRTSSSAKMGGAKPCCGDRGACSAGGAGSIERGGRRGGIQYSEGGRLQQVVPGEATVREGAGCSAWWVPLLLEGRRRRRLWVAPETHLIIAKSSTVSRARVA